jgi:hypothetical protein
MKKSILALLLLPAGLVAFSQKKEKLLKGMYLQWGYNTEWYTNSSIHFKGSVNGVPHDFTIYHARAHDQNDLSAVYKEPTQVSVPQYNYRIGFYLNDNHTRAIEINYDHTKYVVYDNQLLHAKGFIGNDSFDKDTSFSGSQMHFEHTNGANFYQINYVRAYNLKTKRHRSFISALWKGGAGILIPKTDVTLFGKRLDNRFHVAGYCVGLEGGAKIYPFSTHLFFEGTAKTGYANYLNALTVDGGKASHHFGYFELIGLVGYDINF